MPDGIKILLIRIAAVAGAALFCCLGFDHRYGPLLIFALVITWFVFRSYDDWGTFLKRCVLTLPFVVLTEVGLYAFIAPDRWTYWYSGVLIFEALLINAPAISAHYFVTLLSAGAVIFLGLVRRLWPGHIALYSYCLIYAIFFYASYLLILNRKQTEINYWSVLMKALFSALLMVLLFGTFMVSHSFMKHRNIPFEIAFAFSCFLGGVFFIVFYYLGKDYFKANQLFRKGKITESFEDFLTSLKESVGIPKRRKR